MSFSLELRTLKTGGLPNLSKLVSALGLSDFAGNASLYGSDPVLQSPHRLGEATSYALLLEAIAAATIWQQRAHEFRINIESNIIDSIHALHSTHFLEHSGYPLSVGAETVPTNGLFTCSDGRHIMLESGPPYPKLERGYLDYFDCGNNRESIARQVAKYNSEELQETLSERGLPACIAYRQSEWLQHQQGHILKNTPLIEIEKLSSGYPQGFAGGATHPLSGIKVLDFTHVLAGPRSTRSLANYGADVLHISSPYHRDTVAQNLLVNLGKRSAYLLLHEPKDRATLGELMLKSDVFAFSYRTSVAEKFGITPLDIAKSGRSMIFLSINAYGHSGPWYERPGFDQNAQAATGICVSEGGFTEPRFSPVFYLNDFLTGYLAAAGVMAALLRRANEGGSYHVKLSLARTAMWVQDLGSVDRHAYKNAPPTDNYAAKLRQVRTDCGLITELAPAAKFSNMPVCDLDLLHPFGADPAAWW